MNLLLYLLFYLGLFLGGDELILILSYFSALGYWNIIPIFFVIILANLSSDICWFLFGNKILMKIKWKKWKKLHKFIKNLLRRKKPEFVLFISKFIYGIRIITVISLGINSSLSLLRFIFFDILSLMPITSILIFLGYFAGKGTNYINVYKNIMLTIFGLFILSVFVYIIKKWTGKKLNKKYVQSSQHTTKKKE